MGYRYLPRSFGPLFRYRETLSPSAKTRFDDWLFELAQDPRRFARIGLPGLDDGAEDGWTFGPDGVVTYLWVSDRFRTIDVSAVGHWQELL